MVMSRVSQSGAWVEIFLCALAPTVCCTLQLAGTEMCSAGVRLSISSVAGVMEDRVE